MIRNYLKTCPKCNNILEVDDIDYDFDGKQDELLICNKCKKYIMVKVRFGKYHTKILKIKILVTMVL